MKNLSNRNILILSSIDWDTHRQLHHELIDYLIKKNNRILFIENTGSRSAKISDLPRIKKRLLKFIKSSRGFKKISNKITLFSPLFFPYYFNFIFRKINSYLVLKAVNNWLKKNDFNDLIIINFIPNPITYSIINNLKSNLVAYYMADNMTLNNKKFNLIEKKIINKSNLIFFTSLDLKNKIKNISKRFYLPNGVNFELFNNKSSNKKYIKNKCFKIVYLGAVRDVIDENLILKISKEFPNDEIYFIGPILKKIENLQESKNIIFLGQINHKLVPKYLKKFHLGILPYRINLFTKSINPLKIYEYISSGLPVVSTNLPNVDRLGRDFPKINLKIAKTENDFIKKIKSFKDNYKKNSQRELNLFLKKNAWNNRFTILEKWILIKEYENLYINKKKLNYNKFTIFDNIMNYTFLALFVYFLVYLF